MTKKLVGHFEVIALKAGVWSVCAAPNPDVPGGAEWVELAHFTGRGAADAAEMTRATLEGALNVVR